MAVEIITQMTKTVQVDKTTNLQVGDTVVFMTSDGDCHIGEFMGFTSKNALIFSSKVKNLSTEFRKKASSITAAEVVEHRIEE